MKKRRPGRTSSAWIRPDLRMAIYLRDGETCVWCGTTWAPLTLDHLFPRQSPYRTNHPRFLVTSCVSCNCRRRGTRVSAWLRQIPPSQLPMVLRRLQVARYVPVNRGAGRRALAPSTPPPGLPTLPADGVVLPEEFIPVLPVGSGVPL